MGTTHFNKLSGINGVFVGKKGEEVQIAGGDGTLYEKGDKVVKTVTLSVAHDTDGLDEGVTVAELPAGSIILSANVRTTTAWNSGTSAAVYLGYGASLNELVSNQNLKATAGLMSPVVGATPSAILTNATTVKIKAATEGETSAGAAIVILTYV